MHPTTDGVKDNDLKCLARTASPLTASGATLAAILAIVELKGHDGVEQLRMSKALQEKLLASANASRSMMNEEDNPSAPGDPSPPALLWPSASHCLRRFPLVLHCSKRSGVYTAE